MARRTMKPPPPCPHDRWKGPAWCAVLHCQTANCHTIRADPFPHPSIRQAMPQSVMCQLLTPQHNLHEVTATSSTLPQPPPPDGCRPGRYRPTRNPTGGHGLAAVHGEAKKPRTRAPTRAEGAHESGAVRSCHGPRRSCHAWHDLWHDVRIAQVTCSATFATPATASCHGATGGGHTKKLALSCASRRFDAHHSSQRKPRSLPFLIRTTVRPTSRSAPRCRRFPKLLCGAQPQMDEACFRRSPPRTV
jgi:hypothetical protein